MPETKHNFTGGKMNKDLDERLVPNGEYRDAMNIQVSTSEESNVGTVQNILGNKAGCTSYVFEQDEENINFNPQSSIPIGSKVVGSISDEKNDNLYWLISGGKSIIQGSEVSIDDLSTYLNAGNVISENLLPIRLKDMIMRKTPSYCQPVFVDKYGLIVSNKTTIGDSIQFVENTNTNTLSLKDPSLLSEVFTGMQVQGFTASGNTSTTAEVTSVGSLFEIETPYALNYDQIPLAPVFEQYGAVALIGSSPGEVVGTQSAGVGTAQNKIYIYQHDFPSGLSVGDYIDVAFHGSNVGTTNFLEFLTPEIADINGVAVSGLSQSTHAYVTHISQPTVYTNNQQMNEEPVVRITLSQALIDPTTGVNYQQPIHHLFTTSQPNYLTSPVSAGNAVKTNIRFFSNPTSISVNNIVTLPQNSVWLNEIYNIFYPNGVLDPDIQVRIQPNTIWTEFPANSGHSGCISPTSVDPPDLGVVPVVYDNEFAIVECGTSAAMVPPAIGVGRSGPPNTTFTLFVHNTNTNKSTAFGENLISLNKNIDLSSGFDYLYFSHDRVLNYEHNKMITGINIIDDMLLWVDGVGQDGTEPKKINIPRSIKGTYPDGNRHTLLINDLLNYNTQNTHVPIKEDHITLIKKSPQIPPSVDLIPGRSEDRTYTGIVRVANDFDPSATISNPDPDNDIISNNDYDFSSTQPGSVIRLKINEDIDGNSGLGNFSFDWKVGDDVVLKEFTDDGDAPSLPITDYRLKGKIIDWEHNSILNGKFVPEPGGFSGSVTIQIEIDSISGFPPGPITGETSRKYAIDLFDVTEKLFEFKFPRFAYRYKYEDGEYSAYSPFSQVAFLPGGFDYHPKKGYNIGMTNRAKSVIVKDFINQTTPKDVVEIDILYKEDASPNVYVVNTVKPDDDVSINSNFNAWWDNSYEITSDTIHAVLPSNQLLRPWDNVPKKALAQEVTGSRVVYANYLQNFDLKSGNTIKNYYPEFKTSITKFDDAASGAVRSIKSLREYQIGVVFIDEYGRETPVISNTTGTLKLEKGKGAESNRLVVGFGKPGYTFSGHNNFPKNMKYFKFFVKETSGEYYNMAMDRYYDAEDGNVWLSFPSSDRNKVDIDTFLILKKGVERDTIVEEEARYKILAIENEAPDYVKTKKLLLYTKAHDSASQGSGNIFNSSNDLPLESKGSFKVGFNALADTSARELHTLTAGTTDKLYVELSSSGGGKVSQRYRVVDVGLSGTDSTDDYTIKIEGQFGSDVNAFTNDPSGVSSNEITDGTFLRIYKYSIENSPEFDGRFFIKIFSDSTFDENITNSVTEDSQDYRVIAEKKLYLITNDATNELRHKYVFDQGNPPNTSLSGVFPNYYDLHLFRQSNKLDQSHFTWNKIIRAINRMGSGISWTPYGDSSGNSWWNWYEGFGATHKFNNFHGANWQPYDAFFRGINIKGSSGAAFKLGIDDRVSAGDVELEGSTTSDASFEDVWYIDGSTRAGSHTYGFTAPAGWGGSPNGLDSTGVSISPDGRMLEIGFGGIQGKENRWFDTMTGTRGVNREKYYDIGGTNDNYSEEADFCNSISPGAQFRFKEDPSETIYTITGAVNNRFNVMYEDMLSPNNLTTGQHPSHGGSSTYQSTFTDIAAGRLLMAQTSGLNSGSQSNNNNPFSHSQHGEGPGTSNNGYRVSTYFRPSNYSRSWRFELDKPITWNPVAPSLSPIFGGKVIKLTATSTSACTNQITLSTITDTVDTKSLLEVGMVLNSVNGTEDSLASASLAIVVKITESGADYIVDLKKYRSEDGLNISSFTPSGTSGGEIIFKQYVMNGISPNSAKNINFFGNAQGFSDTNHGVAAVGYSIEFIEPLIGDSILPTNPAIWETEPKESTDLDIYYEASGYNPLILDKDTVKAVLPVGSMVSAIGTDAIPPDTTIVQNQMSGLDTFFSTAIVISNSAATAQGSFTSIGSTGDPIDGGTQLKVTRPDGSIVVVVVANNESDLMASSPTYYGRVFGIYKYTYSSDYYLNWHNCYSFGNGVESNRIRDNFNLPFISNGVKASTTLSEQYKEEHRKYGLIYSGLYNSISGVNNLNQFIAAEKITKDINPIYGSIQKLHTRDTDLVTLCEDKILKILANKDAVFNADGNAQLTATANVLGQTIPFVGEYGISTNPESFASESYRAYFSDKVRGAIMRLSRDGLTSVSEHGMKDWFRDNLKLSNTLIGSYDDRQGLYNITLIMGDETTDGVKTNKSTTVSFSEHVRGWVSFKSFVPEEGISCANDYYTFKHGHLYKHHIEDEEMPDNRNTFYNNYRESSIKVVLNELPGSVKNYRTINYEGSHSKVDENLQDNDYYNLSPEKGWYVSSIKTDKQEGGVNEFIEKEGKWYNYIKGKTVTASLNGHLTNHFSSFDEGDFAVQGLGLIQTTVQKSIHGCTDSLATNYNPLAAVDDGSCRAPITGCTDPLASNYNGEANHDDGSCTYPGCITTTAFNYDSNANIDDGSCIDKIFGCTDTSTFTETYSSAESNGKSGFTAIYNTMVNASSTANTSDGNCIPTILGCTDQSQHGYSATANTDYHPNYTGPGACQGLSTGCHYPAGSAAWNNFKAACNHNPLVANVNPNQHTPYNGGSCVFCSDAAAPNVQNHFHAHLEPVSQNAECGTGENEHKDGCRYCGGQHRVEPHPIVVPESVRIMIAPGLEHRAEFLMAIHHIKEDDLTNFGPLPKHQAPFNDVHYQTRITNQDNGTVEQNYVVTNGISTHGMDPNIPTIPLNGLWNDDLIALSAHFNFNKHTYVDKGELATFRVKNLEPDTNYLVEYWAVCSGSDGQNLPLESGVYSTTITTPLNVILGCTDSTGQYNNIDTGAGVMGTWAACNYNPLANTDDGSCEYLSCTGCTTPGYVNSVAASSVITQHAPHLCGNIEVLGCTDPTAQNYMGAEPIGTTHVDDGSCIPNVFGCLGTYGSGSPLSPWVDWQGNLAAINYGCTGVNSTYCNMTAEAPTVITPTELSTYYIPNLSGVSAPDPVVTSQVDPTGSSTISNCIFYEENISAFQVTSTVSGANDGDKDIHISIDQNNTPYDGVVGPGSNLRYHILIQFLDDSDNTVGLTDIGSYDTQGVITAGIDAATIGGNVGTSVMAQFQNSGGNYNDTIFPNWVNGTVDFTNYLTADILQTHVNTHNAAKVNIVVISYNDLISIDTNGLEGYNATKLTINLIGGCTDSTASNPCSGCNVNDGSCFVTTLGCTDPLAFNYVAAATPGNANATTCTTCQAPPNPILEVQNAYSIGYIAAQFSSPPFQTPGFVVRWNNDEMVFGEHNFINGTNYSLRSTSSIAMTKTGGNTYNGTLTKAELNTYPGGFSNPVTQDPRVVISEWEYRIKDAGSSTWWPWRNVVQDAGNNGSTNWLRGASTPMMNSDPGQQVITSGNVQGRWHSASYAIAPPSFLSKGVLGTYSAIFPSTVSTLGTAPSQAYYFGAGTGWNANDMWEFRIRSLCFKPSGEVVNSAWSTSIQYTQPSCAAIQYWGNTAQTYVDPATYGC